MDKIGVIVCSNAGLDYVEHKYDIPVFRSVVVFSENEKYDDYTEISAEEFYNRLATDKKAFPHTAFCSMGKMIQIYEEMKANGYNKVLVIVISSSLSGLYQAIQKAGDEVEDFEVIPYDSKSISYVQCHMALTAAEMFENGASVEDVLAKLDYIRDNHHILVAVDTLEYLIKNGRLSKFSGTVANMLSIRPLLHLNNGKLETLAKHRTSKKARSEMVKVYLEEIEGKDVIPFILHGNAPKEVLDKIVESIKEARPDLDEVMIYPITPVVGAHGGPGIVGLAWIAKF